MLNTGQNFVRFFAQLAQIHFAVAETAFQGVFNGQRLFVDFFLHVVAVNAFITGVVLHFGFDFFTLNGMTIFVIYADGTALNFSNIAFFQEQEAAGHR
ncbi:hypothetical protein SRABI106_03144 [Rahnella aquatilis]|nr:hypothetical protein SRABI106_03144 [Rahnella aquatilis]